MPLEGSLALRGEIFFHLKPYIERKFNSRQDKGTMPATQPFPQKVL
jgi:hypothetical protein